MRSSIWLAHDALRSGELRPDQFNTVDDTRTMAVLLDGAEHLGKAEHYDLEQVATREGLDPGQPRASLLRTLSERFTARLDRNGLRGIYVLEREVISATASMIRRGVTVDIPGWETLVAGEVKARDAAARRLVDWAGAATPEAVLARLRSEGHRVTGTGRQALAGLREHPEIEAVHRFRRANLFLADLGPKVLHHTGTSPDGRLRATIDPLGTATGRFTASNPNLLGLPRRREVRELVIAPPGHVLISADYSAADLRALSVIADDRALQAVFQEGRDPHRETAAVLFRVAQDEVTESQRKVAKAVNFATVYGASTGGIQKYALTTVGVEMSSKDALKFQTLFLHHYAGVAAWQREVSRQKRTEARSLGGRLRRGLDSAPARLNSPVQMTTADALKIAIVRLDTMLAELGASILLPVHDELLVEAPECRAQEVADLVEREMSDAMGGLLDWVVRASVDVGIGRSWADAARSK